MHGFHNIPPRAAGQATAARRCGDAKSGWITLLTTEHYNLQMQRIATINEANGRASIFLGAVAAGLIALGSRASVTGGRRGRSCSRSSCCRR